MLSIRVISDSFHISFVHHYNLKNTQCRNRIEFRLSRYYLRKSEIKLVCVVTPSSSYYDHNDVFPFILYFKRLYLLSYWWPIDRDNKTLTNVIERRGIDKEERKC